jgi:uncharacterized surface anchored protein
MNPLIAVDGLFKASALALVCALVACGGGGGGGNANNDALPLNVNGMAASGAPLANATLQIYDKNGTAVLSNPVKIGSDGSYSATIPGSATGPFVFEVDNGTE